MYVTRPLFPTLTAYTAALEKIWQSRWLTNKGPAHDALERALCDRLRVSHLSLVSNGTAALMLACRALELSGEVVTTPFTSPATVNALVWSGLTPIFADIDPTTMTIAPGAVERAMTAGTVAIVGVHIYGIPCDVYRLQAIADRHRAGLLYDCAHAFGTEIDGETVLKFGDATILSFHATKLFNTAEGGAVVASDLACKQQVDLWRNLGISDELTVLVPGINARMNELEAALGLENLKILDEEYRRREEIAAIYLSRLKELEGLSCLQPPANVRNSRQYFPIRVDSEVARVSRDSLYERLKSFNVFARRYFYPLCSEFPFYRDLPSSDPRNLTVAHRVSREILCLPYYGELGPAGAHRICDMISYIIAN